ncbi:GMC family oxidoreductase N-terminal domain-containing protein [Comamonadaceae bacterium G21597-S1]|nr:GMC family oxidoreductase N-terminal domain-containing protein [Comamonadaceae bacterium G21597-S1]
MAAQEYDYIVVGAGSAGCVLADQLSAGGRATVLVLEAGGHDRRLWINMPIGYGKTFYDERVNWKFEAQSDPGLKDRRIYFPRGKVLGGSSSINAMVYCRGLPVDFDDWAAAGNRGWGWSDVAPVYDRFERRVDADGTPAAEGGPLFVSDVRRQLHPMARHFFAAAQQAGLPLTEDFNGPAPEGVGRYHINTRRGMRWSAADAFLRPALRRGQVTLATGALAERIVFEGRKAVGVSYRQGGARHTARARAAVVLSAGAIQSPQLLQLSGVGPGALLQRHGIAPVLVQEQVGARLQDHLAMSYSYQSREPTLNNVLSSLWGKLRVGVQYVTTLGGPLSISVNQCGGFVRSHAGAPQADMQLYCNPITYTLAASKTGTQIVPDRFAGFILCFQPCRPLSRGRVEIAGPDAASAPIITPGYLSHPEDVAQALRGAQLIRRLENTDAMRGLIRAPIAPRLDTMDDAAMVEDFRNRASTCYHPVGSCAMGPDPATSVVDADLKVHGLEHLYVVDASVFPNVTSGNTHAPTTMVAHKGAQAILAATRG